MTFLSPLILLTLLQGTRGGRLVKGSGTLVSVDDRKEASLRACVAHMLDVDVSEVPTRRETSIRQWLAARNLGLVPVAAPETFEWPGRFLGLKSGSSTWAVYFGVPPGIVYDPLAESDGNKESARAEAAFVLAKHDPQRGAEPGRGTGTAGTVELVALTAEAEGPMRAVSEAQAVEGRGLLGDRYEREAGTFSDPRGRGYDLTLVEAEALEELSSKGVELTPVEARRNLVVRGRVLRPKAVRALLAPRTANAARGVARPRASWRAASRRTLERPDPDRRPSRGASVGSPALASTARGPSSRSARGCGWSGRARARRGRPGYHSPRGGPRPPARVPIGPDTGRNRTTMEFLDRLRRSPEFARKFRSRP
jgi:hypothetical protein